MAHGGVEAIGTLGVIANNPTMKAIAARYGVTLFEDDAATGATGPHIHLQSPRGAAPHG
jgi:hypothetical protein